MKTKLAALIVGMLMGTAATADATSTGDIHYGGIWCKTTPVSGVPSVLCIKESGGYGVAINRLMVIVISPNGKRVFMRVH